MLRKQLGFVFCVTGFMVLPSSCATAQVGSDYDKSARFQNDHTFTVMQREHSGTRNPLWAVGAGGDAIRADLKQKGYVEASDPTTAISRVNAAAASQCIHWV